MLTITFNTNVQGNKNKINNIQNYNSVTGINFSVNNVTLSKIAATPKGIMPGSTISSIVEQMPNLNKLTFFGRPFSDYSFLQGVKTLNTLHIDDFTMSPKIWTQLINLLPKTLTDLMISDSRTPNTLFSFSNRLQQLKNLTMLNLSDFNFNAMTTAKEIAQLKKLKSLAFLPKTFNGSELSLFPQSLTHLTTACPNNMSVLKNLKVTFLNLEDTKPNAFDALVKFIDSNMSVEILILDISMSDLLYKTGQLKKSCKRLDFIHVNNDGKDEDDYTMVKFNKS